MSEKPVEFTLLIILLLFLVLGWFKISSTALYVSRNKYILIKTFRLLMATH